VAFVSLVNNFLTLSVDAFSTKKGKQWGNVGYFVTLFEGI
jgi:hypothetical protein